MDDWFVSFLLSILLVLLYFHVQAQYKTSENLEIYETEFVSKKLLQDTCLLLQPMIFTLPIKGLCLEDIEKVDEIYHVRDVRDFYKNTFLTIEPISLKTSSVMGLLKTDTNSSYFSDMNHDLDMKETVDAFHVYLQPNLTMHTSFDVLFGSRKTQTPLRYHIGSQRFLAAEGNGIRVVMVPWKKTQHLHARKDYQQMEFWSDVNIEHISIKKLDFVVLPGHVLFIPPYWWYSIQFLDTTSCVTSITYFTYVNGIAHVKDYVQYYSQQVNSINTFFKPLEQDKELEKEKEKEKEIETPSFKTTDISMNETTKISLSLVGDLKTTSPQKV